MGYPTTRFEPGTAKAQQPATMANRLVANPWKKNSSGYVGKTASFNEPTGFLRQHRLFRGGTRPTHDQMISYIDADKEQCGVEAIGRVFHRQIVVSSLPAVIGKPPHASLVLEP